MTGDEEQRIRERAYFIWEREGRPQGRALDHRLRAEAEIAAERFRGGERGGRSRPQHRAQADDQERLISARQAAEALFTGNQVTMGPLENGSAPLERTRKPRVLPVLPNAPTYREELEIPENSNQTVPKIDSSQFARIRTWVSYGMTARQVAEVYGLDVGEIERILRLR